MTIKTKILISHWNFTYNKNLEDCNQIQATIEYSNPDDFIDKLETILEKNGTSIESNDFIEVLNLENSKLIFGNSKFLEKPKYFYSNEEIASYNIAMKYIYIEESLEKLDKLIESNADISEIRSNFKVLKEWLRTEHKEFDRQKYDNTLYNQWYSPLVHHLIAQDIGYARVNDSKSKIHSAVYQAKMEYNFYEKDFFEFYSK